MKRKVNLSTYSMIVSGIGLIVLLVALYYSNDIWSISLISAVLVLLCASALFYMPLSVSVDDEYLCVNRSLRVKCIPLSEISSITLMQPTMAERRIMGSGGWFGYWGWFGESSIGKYFAYYGKASDCFLVKLKNGCQYVLGCENPDDIVSRVSSMIGQK